MSRRAKYHIDARFVISTETISIIREACSSSGKFVHVDPRTSLRVHTWKGVPGKFADVLLPDFVPDSPLVCEIGRKIGSFDGNVRWRLTFRTWGPIFDPSRNTSPSIGFPGDGKLSIEEDGELLSIIARWYGQGFWAQGFPQMRYKPDPGPRIGIFMYQWKQWFSFLPGNEVRQAGEVWDQLETVKNCEDIVALNRMASGMLYDLAISLGWRKLSLKEKGKYGLSPETNPWQRVDGLVARLVVRNGGVGQFTLDAAYGKEVIHLPNGVCSNCNELYNDCDCR